ncbi:MAG: hypothetical protein ABR547_08780 [Halanaerobium sp.]
MTIKQNKSLKFALIILLILLLTVQGLKSREIIKEKNFLQLEISKQQQENKDLENEYADKSQKNKLRINEQTFDIKAETAAILSELEIYNLKLIDFSSSRTELNLNLSGDFSSILNFIFYLENQSEALKIDEFKIKENSDQLFFFVKLKNELI